jgi:uncharacterized membrane protein YccF (DUF307 family)
MPDSLGYLLAGLLLVSLLLFLRWTRKSWRAAILGLVFEVGLGLVLLYACVAALEG